jgi:hypothetical protein
MSFEQFACHLVYSSARRAGQCALCLLLVLPAFAAEGRGAKGTGAVPVPGTQPAVSARVVEAYGKLPLSFEPNQGQTDARVKFLSRGPAYTLFLTSDEAVLALQKAEVRSQKPGGRSQRYGTTDSGPRGTDRAGSSSLATRHLSLDDAVVRLKLVGVNGAAKVAGLAELPGKSNYFLGNDPKKWRTNVPNYAKVRYENVYRGVDLVYYGNQRQLEYDFVVAPGADPTAIRLAVGTSQSKIPNPKSKIDENGDLVITLDAGEVRFRKPVVYQPRNSASWSVNSQFTIQNSELRDGHYVLLADNQIGFEVGAHDPARPLIIDPTLSYSTYLGGSGDDTPDRITVDSGGNAYVTGYTSSTDFPTASPLQPPFGGGAEDAFVAKLNVTGDALVYSTYLGGSNDDGGYGIAVDASGNTYLTGYTSSTDFPTASPLQPVSGGGPEDAFVAKLNATGNVLVYSTYLGGSGYDYGSTIVADTAGNVYVTGPTSSTDFPTANALQPAFGGGPEDGFVAKLNAAGDALVYSTYLGGSGDDSGDLMVVDASGNVYVTGPTSSTDFPTVNPLQPAFGGGTADGFVAKLNAAGDALVYSTYLGGSDEDFGRSIAVDASGNAYVTGQTSSADFPTVSPLQPAFSGGTTDGFVAKLNAAGSALVYSTYLGGSDEDFGDSITVDTSGDVYVTGGTYSTDFPTVSPLQPASGGSQDAFITKLNAAGNAIVFSTYLGGSGEDRTFGMALDLLADVYVVGFTASSDFPTVGPLQASLAGGYDTFVTKLTGLQLPVVVLSSSSVDFGDQTVGTTSTPQTVTLTNGGDAQLIFTSFNVQLSPTDTTPSPDFAQNNTCGASLAAGASCTISILFTPTTEGPISAYLVIHDSAAGSPHVIALSGTGSVVVGVVVTLTPTSLDFGNQAVNTTSAPQAVTYGLFTGTVLNVTSITTSGDFSQTNNCGTTIVAGSSCTINVTFTPSAVGVSAGALTITDDGPGSPRVVSLTGTGQATPAGVEAAIPIASNSAFAVDVNPNTNQIYTSGAQTSGQVVTWIDGDTNSVVMELGTGTGAHVNPVTNKIYAAGVYDGNIHVYDGTNGSLLTSVAGFGCPIGVAIDTNDNRIWGIGQCGAQNDPVFTIDGNSDTLTSGYIGTGQINWQGTVNPVTHFLYVNALRVDPTTFALTASLWVDSVNPTPSNNRMYGRRGTDNVAVIDGATETVTGGLAVPSPRTSAVNPTRNRVYVRRSASPASLYVFDGTSNGLIGIIPLPSGYTFGDGLAVNSNNGKLYVIGEDSGGNFFLFVLNDNLAASGVSLSPTSVGFTGNPLNLDCPAKDVTLTNTGDTALTISSIVASAYFSQTNDCPGSLAVGASCTISIKFHPTEVGAYSGTVTITSDAAGSPHTITATGNGTPICILLPNVLKKSVLRGADTTDFIISDQKPSCSPDPLDLSCSLEHPASCALDPARIPPSGSSTLRVSNLQAVTANSLAVSVTATSDFRRATQSLMVLISDFAFTRSPCAR